MSMLSWIKELLWGPEIYVVKPGDSLSSIAAKYPAGVTWRKIYEANSGVIQHPDRIYPGQRLRIPKGD